MNKHEKDLKFEWTIAHEDEIFGVSKSVEQSIYAGFRNVCRSIMLHAVGMAGMNLKDLKSAMESLSANGALRNNPSILSS